MSEIIRINDVHKKFKVYFDKGQSLKEKLLFRNRNHYEDRWVLKGISLSVKKGEAIGLIGENGCGKSTLLKLMTKIIYPDRGSIQIDGRVSSLIELGAGFHPDMSGRENIYTNAAIFGLTRKEIDGRIRDIIEFSELEEFIDNPVRTYSSGMYMRLAFSVAINVDADVLLIDEILAVGDANFQAKCFAKMQEIKSSGTTIVIVSHALGSIEQICERSFWIDNGVIRQQGTPREVHTSYLEAMGEKREHSKNHEAQLPALNAESSPASAKVESSASPSAGIEEIQLGVPIPIRKKRFGNRDIEFTQIEMRNAQGQVKSVFYSGEPIFIVAQYRCNKKQIESNVGFAIYRSDGIHCYGTNTMIEHHACIKMREKGEVQASIEQMNLLPGEYNLDIAAYTREDFPQDDIKECLSFTIVSNNKQVGICRMNVRWQTDDGQLLQGGEEN